MVPRSSRCRIDRRPHEWRRISSAAVQTETHRGLRNTLVGSRACIGSGAALPSGDTVEEGALSNAGSVATRYDPSARDPR